MLIRFLCTFLVVMISASSCQDGDKQKNAGKGLSLKAKTETGVNYDTLLASLEHLKKDPALASATLGYFIVDVTSHEPVVVAEYNTRKPMIPASTLKIFVTGACLDIFGPSIIREVTITNQMSVNWRSSKLLRKIGGKVYHSATTGSGAKAILQFWQDRGVDTEGMVLDDGNGLSRNNAISPKQLVDALYAMRTSPYYLPFYESLPLAGLTGTLRRAMKGTAAEGRIRAKTGTIASVKSFAGYAHTVSGRRIVFSLIINNFDIRVKPMKKKLEAVLVKVAEI